MVKTLLETCKSNYTLIEKALANQSVVLYDSPCSSPSMRRVKDNGQGRTTARICTQTLKLGNPPEWMWPGTETACFKTSIGNNGNSIAISDNSHEP
jgi:hypothetical protein